MIDIFHQFLNQDVVQVQAVIIQGTLMAKSVRRDYYEVTLISLDSVSLEFMKMAQYKKASQQQRATK